MTAGPSGRPFGADRFRLRLWVAIMLVVSAATIACLAVAERQLEAEAAADRRREFAAGVAARQAALAERHGLLVERCRALAARPRIHAALEDNALDLLYPTAENELRDVLASPDEASGQSGRVLRARFYRFLDRDGGVIPAPSARGAGPLPPAGEAVLRLNSLPAQPITGYLSLPGAPQGVLTEVVTTPIMSTETGEPIAGLVVGFDAAEPAVAPADDGLVTGIWLPGRPVAHEWEDALADAVAREPGGGSLRAGTRSRWLVFFTPLNAGSPYPLAQAVSAYPLSELTLRENSLRWQIATVGSLVLLAALVASRFLSGELAAPVERLAQESERSARFSADASHQLKTPVTVLRAGLEELLRQPRLTPAQCAEVSSLVHQTYRLSTLIDDLLLLARMDAGRLRLALGPVDLSGLIEAAIDDLGAQADDEDVAIDATVPPGLTIAGERRYTAIVLQNLLENARKYNRPGGRIRIACDAVNGSVTVAIGNTGGTIPPAAQAVIFERFHRGAKGENVPGYGLGLNLARELARLHGGELTLQRSADDWTEFRWTVPRA